MALIVAELPYKRSTWLQSVWSLTREPLDGNRTSRASRLMIKPRYGFSLSSRGIRATRDEC
jgi:hypothetical protein